MDHMEDSVEDFHDEPAADEFAPCANDGLDGDEPVEDFHDSPVRAPAQCADGEEEEVLGDAQPRSPQSPLPGGGEIAFGFDAVFKPDRVEDGQDAGARPAADAEGLGENVLRPDLLQDLPPPAIDPADEDDELDDVGAMVDDLGGIGAAEGVEQEELLADSLIDPACSQRERELWQQVRPRSLRKEAADLEGLRLPSSAVARLMKLHPGLQVRSAEALDIVNHSTVMLLQHVVQAAARGSKSNTRIQFDDIRSVCLSAKEMHFMLPISTTLDASATKLQKGGEDKEDLDGDADGPAKRTATSSRQRAAALDPKQGKLGAAMFAKNAAVPGEDDAGEASGQEEISAGEHTPEKDKVKEREEKQAAEPNQASSTRKRKAPGKEAGKEGKSAPKAARKAAAKPQPAKDAGASGSLLGFFRRAAPAAVESAGA